MADSVPFNSFNELVRFDSFDEDFFLGFDLRSMFGQMESQPQMTIDVTERKWAEESIPQPNAEVERCVRERTAQLEGVIAKLRQALEEAERLHQELREQCFRDPLTGLFNRRFLDESLRHEVTRASRTQSLVGIVMFDMDNFKHLNDEFGHVVGDAVLREVGELVQANVRAADLACRYGGDEFVIIMPETSFDSARHKGEQLHEQLKFLPSRIREVELPEIEFSMGVAAFPDHGMSEVQLLKSVDAALYRAKEEGGGRIIVAG